MKLPCWTLLAFLSLGLALEEKYSYWTCVAARAIHIKIEKILKDHGTDMVQVINSAVDAQDCVEQCASQSFSYALFSRQQLNMKCICVKYNSTDITVFNVYAADISDQCEPASGSSPCPSGLSDYSLFCQGTQPCGTIKRYMKDPTWTNGDVSDFESWMNYFPKCVSKASVDMNQLSGDTHHGLSTFLPEKCALHGLFSSSDFDFVSYDSDSNVFSCFHGDANAFNSELITMDSQCQPCNYPQGHESHYKTCGDKDTFSVYCRSDDCKRAEIKGTVFFHYFGCFQMQLLTGGVSLANLNQCLEHCVTNDLSDMVLTTTDDKKVDCHCLRWAETQDIWQDFMNMSVLRQGCDRWWSPPYGDPVGEGQLYSLHCTDQPCEELLNANGFVTDPLEESCLRGDATTSTTTATSTITSTTTTTYTSTTTSSTSSTVTTTTQDCTRTCPGREDDRGFYWNQTCEGYQLSLASHCPPQTQGQATWTCNAETLEFTPMQPDRSLCIPEWINYVDHESLSENGDPKNITETILLNIKDYNNREKQITSGTVIKLIQVGNRLPGLMSNSENGDEYLNDMVKTEAVVRDYVQVIGDLFHHDLAWEEHEFEAMQSYATELVQSNELLGFFLMKVAQSLSHDLIGHIISDTHEEVIMQINSCRLDEEVDVQTLPVPSYISLSTSQRVSGDWSAIGVTYKNSLIGPSKMFSILNTDLVSHYDSGAFDFNADLRLLGFTVKVNDEPLIFDQANVFIEVPMNESVITLTPWHDTFLHCVYWDEEEYLWSSKGCESVVSAFRDKIRCFCNHTTNFGVIFDINGDVSNLSLAALNIISNVLCGLSAILCLVTFMSLFFSKDPRSPRTVIQMNRAITLFLFYFFFLVGVDRSYLQSPPWLCSTFAILVQFFGLCTFSWTALEGLHVYRALVYKRLTDIDGKITHTIRYVLGYGIPSIVIIVTIVVALTTGAGLQISTSDAENDLCWLSQDLIWAFAGPVAVVVLWNVYVMARAFAVAIRAQNRKHKDQGQLKKVMAMVRGFVILNFLLGTTWIFGFVMIGAAAKYTAFIFVILNGSVGIFLFVHTVLMSKSLLHQLKLRLRLTRRRRSSFYFTTEPSSSGGNLSRAKASTVAPKKSEFKIDTDTESGGKGTETTTLSRTSSGSSAAAKSATKVGSVSSAPQRRRTKSHHVPTRFDDKVDLQRPE